MPVDHTDPRDTFSDSAGRYLISADHQSGPDLEIISQVASQLFPAVTVDMAVGAGHALRAASPFSALGVALDLTMEMLLVAREHLLGVGFENLHFIQSHSDNLPLADTSVSLLTCRIAPHHFTSIPGFLNEVVRVLEPAGQCVIIDSVVPENQECDRFINEVEKLRDPSHVRSHGLKDWLAFFKTAGLETISVDLFERTHPFQEWAARTGLDEGGIRTVEKRFREAPEDVRTRFKVKMDEKGKVKSYTDEKGIFRLKKKTASGDGITF